jgi:hypothetical protein
MLARLQLAPGKQHDLTAAVSGFEKSCSAAGCWRAAGGYLASRGQLAKAQPFFDRACQANDVDGCEEVGRTRVLRGERGKAVEALLEGPCESGSRVACRAVASISSGARAKHFYELGKEREGAISDDIRQSYSRTVDGKGSTGDSILMAATILTGGFPALFAILPSRPVTGFGFLERDYPDP